MCRRLYVGRTTDTSGGLIAGDGVNHSRIGLVMPPVAARTCYPEERHILFWEIGQWMLVWAVMGFA
jgi:hypothetical protein